MGSNESKARVIDENDEYRYGVTTSFDQHSSSPSLSALRSKWSSVSKRGFESLADVPSTVENAFALAADVLETYGEETNENLMKWFKIVKGGKFFSAGAGIVLNLLVDDAVVTELNKLCEEVREVRSDIKELERTIKWETARIQYADICTKIVAGMEYCKQIQSNAENESLKHDYEERLKELCSNQSFTLAINTLLDGITGKGDFRVDILQLTYDQTNGVRADVMRMAARLLQLLTGGMITLLTYETLVRGRKSAEQLEQSMYADRVKEAEQCYMNVIERCVHKSKENMAKDVDRICEEAKEFKDLPKEICNELARKYDWLKFQCMAYRSGVVHCHGSRIEKPITVHPGAGTLKYLSSSYDGDIVCFYASKHAPLHTFSSSEKRQIDKIFSKWYRKLLSSGRGENEPIKKYMNQISDKRQCWAVGFIDNRIQCTPNTVDTTRPCNGLHSDIFHAKSEGVYKHLRRYGEITCYFCFVSIFFQD